MITAEIILKVDTLADGDKKMLLNVTGPTGERGALLTGCIESNAEFRAMVLAAVATYFARNPSKAPADLVALLLASGISTVHLNPK